MPGDTSRGGDKEIGGKDVSLKDDAIDLKGLSGGAGSLKAGKTAVLFAVIKSDGNQDLAIGAGADWWMEWYVNGRSVHSTMSTGNGSGAYSVLNHSFSLPLVKGDNRLLAVLCG